MVIALEGLPGAGKTTSAHLLAARLGAHALCETTDGHPFLETVYDDARRFDLQVELAFLVLHNAGYRQAPRDQLVISDFSPVKDLLFADLMLSGRSLSLFEGLYEELYAGHPRPELTVYLDASPKTCLQRIRERMAQDPERQFEAGLDIERLTRIQSKYEARLAELADDVGRVEIRPEDSKRQVGEAIEKLILQELA